MVEGLLDKGYRVNVFDIRKTFSDDRVSFFVGDLCSKEVAMSAAPPPSHVLWVRTLEASVGLWCWAPVASDAQLFLTLRGFRWVHNWASLYCARVYSGQLLEFWINLCFLCLMIYLFIYCCRIFCQHLWALVWFSTVHHHHPLAMTGIMIGIFVTRNAISCVLNFMSMMQLIYSMEYTFCGSK